MPVGTRVRGTLTIVPMRRHRWQPLLRLQILLPLVASTHRVQPGTARERPLRPAVRDPSLRVGVRLARHPVDAPAWPDASEGQPAFALRALERSRASRCLGMAAASASHARCGRLLRPLSVEAHVAKPQECNRPETGVEARSARATTRLPTAPQEQDLVSRSWQPGRRLNQVSTA